MASRSRFQPLPLAAQPSSSPPRWGFTGMGHFTGLPDLPFSFFISNHGPKRLDSLLKASTGSGGSDFVRPLAAWRNPPQLLVFELLRVVVLSELLPERSRHPDFGSTLSNEPLVGL